VKMIEMASNDGASKRKRLVLLYISADHRLRRPANFRGPRGYIARVVCAKLHKEL
jgi:hypothetical protein